MFKHWARCIICIDMNAFYASVEQRMQPKLRRKPIAVTNGDKGSCIITCSYEARAYGIYTGMRFQEGVRLCPQLVRCPSRPQIYADVSRKIMHTLHDITPDIEIFSVDEAFLDMTHTYHRFSTPEDLAMHIRYVVWHAVKLPLSIGIGTDKTIAKYAAKYKKPMGITVIYPEQVTSVIGPLPVSELCGVGPGISKFLKKYGAHSCQDVAKLPVHILAQRFGYLGRRIWLMCQGKDPDPVRTQLKKPQSMGHGKILPPGSKGKEIAYKYLCTMAFKLSTRLQQHKLWTKNIRVSIRYYKQPWYSIEHTLLHPTQSYEVFIKLVRNASNKVTNTHAIRQVHVGTHTLYEYVQQDMLITHTTTSNKTEDLVQRINKRFGAGSISPARLCYHKNPEVIAPAWKPDSTRDYIE